MLVSCTHQAQITNVRMLESELSHVRIEIKKQWKDLRDYTLNLNIRHSFSTVIILDKKSHPIPLAERIPGKVGC